MIFLGCHCGAHVCLHMSGAVKTVSGAVGIVLDAVGTLSGAVGIVYGAVGIVLGAPGIPSWLQHAPEKISSEVEELFYIGWPCH